MPNRRLRLLISLAGIALIMGALESLLPADAFYVGDSGVKLIATREVLAHPARPFDVDPPAIGDVTFGEFRDPFFAAHGDHAHAVTSPLFPILSAPFLGLFGLRGLAVLPILGFIGSLLGLSWMGEAVAADGRVGILWAAFALSPLFFYGLEFWEHACAAGAAYLGTGLWLRTPSSQPRAVAGGMLIGFAIGLRPEAIWYAIALAVAWRWLPRPGTRGVLMLVAAGIVLALTPLALFNLAHLGSPIGLHAEANATTFDRYWIGRHWTWLEMWLIPRGLAAAAVAVAVLAAAVIARANTSRTRPADLFVLACTALLATLAARRHFPIESWWAVFPASLLLVSMRWRRPSGSAFLVVLGLVQIVGVLFTAPNDSAQWGPRYLLLAAGPLSMGVWQILSTVWHEHRLPERTLVVVILAASLGVQRLAFKELRAARQHYSALQHQVIGLAGASPILTDVWWFDQETSAYGPPPVHLFAADDRAATMALQRLVTAGVSDVIVVTIDGSDRDARLARWLTGTSFRAGSYRALTDPSLVGIRLTR